MAIRTTRESDNKNKARRESLREPRHGQSVFGNTPRDSRKRQGKRRKTCGTPANAKANAARLAGLPQTPKHFPRDLRDSRKRQSISRETCGSTRKRQSISRGTCGSTRKRQGKRRETCGTPANTKAFPVGLAPVVQAFPKTLCSLQPSIQAILQGLGASFFRSSSRCKDFWKGRSAVEGIRFVLDRSFRGYTLLRSISEVPI